MSSHNFGLGPLPPPDCGLKAPARKVEDTFSAMTVIKETWFPHLLTEKEKQQIGPKRTAAAMQRTES